MGTLGEELPSRKGRPGPTLAAIVAAAVALVAVEAFLRSGSSPCPPYRDGIIIPAKLHLLIQNTNYPKIDKRILVETNSLGFRGKEPPSDFASELTLVVLGGATTRTTYVSEGKTWVDLLGADLSTSFEKVWINNAGLDGHSSFGHRILLDRRVLRMKPKVVLFLMGLDDVGRDLMAPLEATAIAGGGSGGLFARLLSAAAERSAIVSCGLETLRSREARKLRRIRSEMQVRWAPILNVDSERVSLMLADHRRLHIPGYASRVEGLVDRCRVSGVEPVLITAPALYGNDVDPTTKVFLGTLEADAERGVHGALAWSLLESYNDVLRDVGSRKGVFVVDLARTMPKDSRYYYDFTHFNNDGASEVARLVFQDLCPFLRSRYATYAAPGACAPKAQAPPS